MKVSVVGVYRDQLQEPADTFRAEQARVTAAESAWAKESTEAIKALNNLDQPFREARAVVAAYLPNEVLPDTLKALSTDTDKQRAIESLLTISDKNHEQAWAANLLAGDFGVRAPTTITELRESVAANKVLSKAKADRAKAFGPAYEQYLAFKWVVREALGSKSKQYKRIHVRGSFSSGPTEPTTAAAAPAVAEGGGEETPS